MFGVLLVYVSTLASAVGAVLPLVPVWLIALPAAAQLALQAPPCRLLRAADIFTVNHLRYSADSNEPRSNLRL